MPTASIQDPCEFAMNLPLALQILPAIGEFDSVILQKLI
jgi:hypothetical protein